MTGGVLLSFCIPTFSRAGLLSLTIERMAMQIGDRTDIEIVVSDNASVDDTPSVLKALSDEYGFLRYVRQPSNVGPDLNIAHVVEMATGQWVWLFGDDDTLLPGALDRVLQSIEDHPDVAAVFVNWLEPSPLASDHLASNANDFLRTVFTAPTFLASHVIRRSLWTELDPQCFVGTRFLHYYMLHTILRGRSAFCLADCLVSPEPPAQVDDHWVLSPDHLCVFYGHVGQALDFLERDLGYDPRIVARVRRAHFASLPRAIVAMRGQDTFDPDVLAELRRHYRGRPLAWLAVRLAALMPRAWAVVARRAWKLARRVA